MVLRCARASRARSSAIKFKYDRKNEMNSDLSSGAPPAREARAWPELHT